MNSKRLQSTFFEMVKIDSPSYFEAPMATYCSEALIKLGFSVRFDDSESITGSNTGNLIAFLPGTSSSGVSENHIILSAHMDCVEPCEGIEPIIEDGVIRSAGDTILSADDKAGIAAIFEAVQSVVEEGRERPSITVLLTTCEEVNLRGAGALSQDVFSDGAPCFVFDADGRPGTIILGAPTHYTLEARFFGRAAHAGVEPEMGISAIQMAASAIETMELGRLDESTTANVGVIEGGCETNVVPDKCLIRGECRSLYDDRVQACRMNMTKACEDAAERFGGSVELSWNCDYLRVLRDEDDPFIQNLVTIAKKAGLEPRFAFSGGGADTNVLNAKGAQAVTLGIGMTNFHSTDEYILVEDLEGITRFCEAIIVSYA